MPVRTRRTGRDDSVLWATIDHPPLNLLDAELIAALAELASTASTDDSVRVLVVDSADEEFWIAHADVTMLVEMVEAGVDVESTMAGFHAVVELFRTMPKPTIAIVEGRARGGGCELALAFDLRYGTIARTVLGQPEVALGILPGGGGTQRWPRLTNRSRALEVILGGDDIDAETAERWGALTRVFPPGEVEGFVEALTARIVASPPEAVAAAKAAIDAPGSAASSLPDDLAFEASAFASVMTEAAAERMEAFLRAGGQQREAEIDVPGIIDRM